MSCAKPFKQIRNDVSLFHPHFWGKNPKKSMTRKPPQPAIFFLGLTTGDLRLDQGKHLSGGEPVPNISTRLFLGYRCCFFHTAKLCSIGVAGKMGFTGCLLSGDIFIFINRRRDRIKLLCWDRTGFVIWYKRLEQGTFELPGGQGTETELSPTQLTLILEGISLASVKHRKRYIRP